MRVISIVAACFGVGTLSAEEPRAWLGTDLFRPGTETFALDYSPDGKLLASGGAFQTVCLWDAETGRLVRRLHTGSTSKVCMTVAFTPDGEALFSSEPFVLWDVKTGHRIIDFEDTCDYAALSPRGDLVAYAARLNRRSVAIYDVRRREIIRTLEPPAEIGTVNGLAFSPDGDRLAIDGYGASYLGVWDVAEGVELFTCESYDQAWDRLMFSPDGSILANSEDHALRTWDAETGAPLRTLIDSAEWSGRHPFCFQRTADGPLLVADHHAHVHLFDPKSGELLRRWPVHPAGASALAISPDGKTLAGAQSRDTAIRLWDVETGKLKPTGTPGHAATVVQLAPSSDGRRLTSRDAAGTVVEWEVAGRDELRKVELPGLSLRGHILSGNGRWAAFPLPDGGTTAGLRPIFGGTSRELAVGGRIRSNVMSIDRAGCRLAVGGPDGIRVRSLPAGGEPLLVPPRGADGLSYLALSADGTKVAAAFGGPHHQVVVWDAKTGRELRRLGVSPRVITGIGLSPDGRTLAVLVGSPKGNVAVDVLTGREWPIDCPSFPGRPVFSGDGNLLGIAGSTREPGPDGWLVEASSGKLIRGFAVPESDIVFSLGFSPDGRTLYGGTNLGRIAVWDLWTDLPAGLSSQALWERLKDPDPAVAYPAIRVLAGRPADAARLIRKELKPARPPEGVSELIDGLGSPSYNERQRAAAGLVKLGELAIPELRKVANGNGPLEASRMAERLIRLIAVPPDRLYQRRALQILEFADAEETSALLRELAGGADGAWLTTNARATLTRVHE